MTKVNKSFKKDKKRIRIAVARYFDIVRRQRLFQSCPPAYTFVSVT